MNILEELKNTLTESIISTKGKDIIVKSKDRDFSFCAVEKYLLENDYEYSNVFKKSKSSSKNVLSVGGVDIVFKPIMRRGLGGLSFEKEFESDLLKHFQGVAVSHESIKHKQVLKSVVDSLGINNSQKWKVKGEGSKNQKRTLSFDGQNIVFQNNTGETLTDITLESEGKTHYLSLKMSKSYYTVSSAIGKYFSDKTTQSNICNYFGFDGKQMGGFGEEFSCTSKGFTPGVKQNLENLLADAIGYNCILVHKKTDSDVLVKSLCDSNKVIITDLSDKSYSYPIKGVRKYANIKVKATINNSSYLINFQFRGTTAADVGPKYLRILLERV